MKRIFKYSLAILTVAAGLAACSDSDDNYQPASVTGPQVFFSKDLQSQYEISNTESSFTIPVMRGVKSGALDVPITVTMSNGSIFELPSTVSFADDSDVAQMTVKYDPAEIVYGKYDTITVAIADAALATNYGLSSYTFTAGITEWVKMNGQGTYRDDLIGSLWGVGNQTWAVNIYESAITPGRYMVEAPYSPDTDFRNSALWDDDQEILQYYEDTGNCNMIIDATDPDYVYFDYFDTGLKNLPGEGMMGFLSYVWYWLQNGNTLEDIKAARPTYFGKLEEGVISFPTPNSLVITLDGELSWYGNANGMTAIALPGYAFADYTVELAYDGIFTSAEGETFAVGSLTLGADATDVKAVVLGADADVAAVADAIAAGDLEAVDVKAGSIRVPIAEELTGKLQLIAVVLKDGEVKGSAVAPFEYYGAGGSNPWKTLGTGLLTDNFFITVYSPDGTNAFDPETFEVEIQENSDEPGLYRLVNPFEYYSEAFESYTPTNFDINAADPDGVYFGLQQTGIDDGNGMTSLCSWGGYMLGSYSFDQLKEAAYLGTLKDGVITLPKFHNNDYNIDYQGLFAQGSDAYYTGQVGDFKVVLPEAVSSEARAKARAHGQALKFATRMNLRPFSPKSKVMKNMPLGKKIAEGQVLNLR